MIKIKRGLDIPITGKPEQQIHPGAEVHRVAVLGRDYGSYKSLPTLLVEEGDRVRLGQPLVRGKQLTTVTTNSPGTGVVEFIERGARRAIHSIAIRLEGDEEETFNSWDRGELAGLNRTQVQENLLASGLWLAFRTRPYSLVADPDTEPHAIFVTAMDTNPLAADPALIISESPHDFNSGLQVIARLTPGKVFVCKAAGAAIGVDESQEIAVAEFAGPHPAGLAGTHIHFLSPVSEQRQVWHLGYQDVIAIGRLFTSGRLSTERIIALGGPQVVRPRLIRTRLGASIKDLLEGELERGESRAISGSILSGHHALGKTAFLGRYHL
ncbi:MAG: NADH:ubiquinone reductase (Na(+)-transporting) subunit A, partial [Thiohalobacterales bacterium]|nr:NADH:ubiquinone reductase (Na(+)-transporting) subunit A [Thiohalobacterales bacterium]